MWGGFFSEVIEGVLAWGTLGFVAAIVFVIFDADRRRLWGIIAGVLGVSAFTALCMIFYAMAQFGDG
jgi:hypothetical protein